MQTGSRIQYDDVGRGSKTLLCLPGWCVHRTVFAPLVDQLASQHRVLSLDWRGHGGSAAPTGDFGEAGLVDDALAVIEAAGVGEVVPIAQAHAGWVALALRRKLGSRVARTVAVSWTMTEPPPPMAGALRALQDPATWQETRDKLVGMWLAGGPDAVAAVIRRDTGSHDAAMWARAGREIAAAFAREGNPLAALAGLAPAMPTLQLYCQPPAPEYLELQESFARANPWFHVVRLAGAAHFPTLELPAESARAIAAFVA